MASAATVPEHCASGLLWAALLALLLTGVSTLPGMEKEIKPYGCGPFVYESYLIFCCGRGASIQASDKNLRAYCAWLRRELGISDRTALDAVEI
jgi:hypothetical protein